MPLKQYDADNSYKESAIQMDAYVHQLKKRETYCLTRLRTVQSQTELFLDSDGKLKVFDPKTGNTKEKSVGTLTMLYFHRYEKNSLYEESKHQ